MVHQMPLSSQLVWIFPIIGICMLSGSFYAEKSRRDFLKNATEVRGKIIGFTTGKSTLMPVFQFTTPEGRTLTRQSHFGYGTPHHEVGDEEAVLYVFATGSAEVKEDAEGHFLTYFLIAMGGGFLIIGLSVAYLMRSRTKPVAKRKENEE